jgi:hypothetical protein
LTNHAELGWAADHPYRIAAVRPVAGNDLAVRNAAGPVLACGGYHHDCSTGEIEFATIMWVTAGVVGLVFFWGFRGALYGFLPKRLRERAIDRYLRGKELKRRRRDDPPSP